MDLKSMKRKDLQSLCKQHGIPANATNLGMIESLSAVLQVEEKVEVKRKGCLRGSGGSSGEDLGKKTVTFLLEDGDESDFEFGEKSKRRRMSGVVATGWRRGSEGSESGEGVGVRRTRSRGLGEMVMWSPGVGKKKVVERVEGVRCNVDEVGNEEEAGVTRSLRNPEVVSDKSRKGMVKRKASETGGNVEEGPSRRRLGRNQAKLEENSGDEDGDVGKSKKRGKKDVEVVSDKGVDKEAVMEPTRRSTRTSSNVLDDGLSLDMDRKSVKEKKNLAKDAKVGGGVASVSTRRMTRSSATLVEDVTSLSVVEKPVKDCEAIRKSRPLTQGLVSAPKPDVEAEIEPVRRTTRNSSNLVEDATSLAVVEKRVSEGKATKKGKSQKQGKVPASLLNSEVVTEPVRRTTRSSSTLEEDGTSLPRQVTKKVKSQKQGKAAVSLADTEVLIEPIRRTTLNSSTLVEEGIPLVTEVAKAKSKKQTKFRTLDSGGSITLLPGNESVTEPTRRSTQSSSKSLEGETTSAAVTTPERRSMRSSSKLLEGEVRSVSKQGNEEEGAITYEKRSTRSSSKLLEGETSYVLRQGDKEEAATKSGRRQTRSSLKLSEGDTSFVSKHRDKEEAATTSGKRSTRSSSKLTEVETSPATELGDKQEALTTSGKRSTQSSSKLLEGETNSDTELGNKEEAVPTPERRSTRSSSKLLEDVSSVPVLSSYNISVGKDKLGKQATNRALKSGDLKTPLLEAITSTTTTRKSMCSSKQQDLTATSPVNEVVSTVTRRATRDSSKALEDVSATSPVIEAVTMPTRRSTPSTLNLSVGEALLEVEKLGDASSASLLDSPTVTESMRRSTRRSSILNMFKSPSVRVEADGGDESVQKKKYGGPTSLLSSGGRATNDSILRSEVERVYGEAQVNSALNKNETTSTTIGENESDTIEMPVEGKEVCMSNIEPTTDAVRNLPEDYEYCPSDLSEVSCKITEEKSSGDCSNVVLPPHSSSETLKLVKIEVENLPTLHLSVGSEENMPMSVIEASVVLGNEGSSEQDIIPDGEDARYLSEQRDIMSAGLVVDSSPKSIEPEAMKQLNEDTDVTPGITTKVNSDIESAESLELSELVGEAMENMESQETKSRIERHDGISRKKAYEIVLDKFDQSDEVEEEKDDGVGTAENEREATTGPISPSESMALGLIFGDQLKENCAQSSPELIMDNATTVGFNGNENESDTIEMSVEGRDVSIHDMEPPNVERNLPKDNEYSPLHIAEASCEITEYKSSGDCRNVIISPHSSDEPLKQVKVDVENFPAVGQSVGPEENMPMGGTETPAMLGNEGSFEQVDIVAAGGEHARHLSAQQIDITNASSDVDSVGNSPKSIEHTAMEQLNEVSDVSPETTTTANFNIGSQRSLALDQVVEENVTSNLSSQTAGEEMIPPLENSPPALDENVQSFMKIDDEEVVDIKAALEETRNGEEFQSYVSSFPQADLQEGEVTESPNFNKAGFSATTDLANLSPQFDAKSNDENGVVVLSTSKVHTELDVRKGVGKDIAEISSTSKVHTELDVRKGVRKDIADISPLHCECLSEAKFMIGADASECKEAGKEETYILGSVNLVDKYEEGNTTAAFVSTVQNDNNEDQNKNSDLGSEMDEALPNADQPLVGLQGEIGSCIKQSLSTVVTFQDEKHIDISLSLFDCKTEVDDDATKCWNFCKTKLDFKGFEVTAGSKSIPDIHLTRGGSNSEEANCGDKFESLERTSNVTEAWDEPGASEMFVNELFHMDSEVAGFANDNSQVGQWGCRFHEENFCGDECESFMEVSTNEASATREDDNMLSSSFEDYLRMDYRDSGLVPLEKNLIQEMNDDNENEETYSTRQYKLLEQSTSIQEASDVSKLTEDCMVTVSDYSKLDGRLEESIIVDQERVTPYINESKKSEPDKAFLTSQDTLIFSDAATVRSSSTSKIQESENETLENKKYFEDFCWSDALPDDYLKSATDVNEEQNKTGDIKEGVHSIPSFGISNLNSLIDDGTKNKENTVDLKKGSSFKYIGRATVSNSTRQPLQSVRKTID